MQKLIIHFMLAVFSIAPLALAGQTNSITASDKAFFEQVRKAVLSDNMKSFAQLVSYPILIRTSKGDIKANNQNDLTKQSAIVLSERVKTVFRNQSADLLFKNWHGIMVGAGEIWFSEVAEKAGKNEHWVYRVIAINVTPEPDRH
jgi:hypothetical protein